MKQKLHLAIALSAFALLASCQKNEDVVQAPTVKAGEAKESLVIGETVSLNPVTGIYGDYEKLTYSWTINGELQPGTGNKFTFEAKARGQYRVVFKASYLGKADSAVYSLTVAGAYENGFFLVNEGWFGHEAGSVTFYPWGADTVQTWANKTANPGTDLGTTTQYGAIYNGKIYLVSKQGYAGAANLVVADENTLVQTASIADLPSDGRAFAGVDATRGLLTAASGLYRYDISTNTVGTTVAGVSGQTGDIIVSGNYVFLVSSSQGLVILNKSDYSVAKTIAGVTIGFIKANDGKLWAAGGTKLLSINPTTLDTASIALPFTAYASWGAWQAGAITYSPDHNAIYIVKQQSWGQDGNQIYKYTVGSGVAPSLFATYTGKFIYRTIAYSTYLDQLIVTTVNSGWGINYSYNALLFVDPVSAATVKTISYTGYYFPAMPVFHQ